MNFTHIKAFYTVAKLESFTLAAQELNVSQPTLSQQVKSLERHFDLPLIKRNRKGMQLTREGEIIFSYAEKLMTIAREMDREIEDLHTRLFKIGTTPTLSRYFLPSIVLKLKEINPDLKVQIYTGLSKEILKMVLDYECHVGVLGRVHYPDHVIFRNIFKPKLCFISKDIEKEKIRLKDLSDYPIIFPEEGSATRDYIIGEFRKRKISLNNFMDCENPAAIKHMVHLGMGGAFFPFYGVEEDVRGRKYRCTELIDDLHLTIDLIYLKDWKESKAVKTFIAVLRKHDPPTSLPVKPHSV